MPKTRYFLEKSYKNRRSFGGSAPNFRCLRRTPCYRSHMPLQLSTYTWF